MVLPRNVSISDDTLKRAIEDLRKQLEELKESQATQLIDDVDTVQLQISLQIAGQRKNTPIVIKLPHPLFDVANGDSAILFVSDNDTQSKGRLQEVPVAGVEKVINLGKARKNLSTYKLKRDLMKRYSVYLADEAIIPMMPSIIGKKAMDAKKIPFPIKTKVNSAQTLAENVKAALSSTQLFLFGTCTVVRVAHFDSSNEEILDNLKEVLRVMNERIPVLAIEGVILKSSKGKGIVLYKAPGEVVAKVAMMTPEEKLAYWGGSKVPTVQVDKENVNLPATEATTA